MTGTPLPPSQATGRLSGCSAVSVVALRKTYDGVTALDGISFEVAKGEVFGLLGPNGAGKTTTLECLEGLRRPDSGSMAIFGEEIDHAAPEVPQLVGVQLQTSGLPPTMTCREAMRFFCAYHRVRPAFDLLERLGLGDRLDVQYEDLSTGLKRRLALALAVAHEPPVLVLDEPTAGLDVVSRTELHRMIAEMSAQGTTVLLATHDMAEAEGLADRVAILLRGRIVAAGSPRELTSTAEGLTKVSVRSEHGTIADVAGLPAVERATRSEQYTVLFTSNTGAAVSAVLRRLEEAGDPLIDLRVERPSLEERFLELTNEEPEG